MRRTGFMGLVTVASCLVLLVTASGALAGVSTGDGSWVWQNPSPQGNDLTATSFVDAQHGWAVGPDVILATTDGGASWQLQDSGVGRVLAGVSFADASHGWVVGWGGVILATTDGGTTWATQATPGGGMPNLDGVTFVNDQDGWAVSDAGGIATTDGGTTWTQQNSYYLSGVAGVDADHVWTVGQHSIYGSTDGGATWAEQAFFGADTLKAVAFSDSFHGWAVGESNTDAGVVLATTDGGATWVPETLPAIGPLSAVTFFDAEHGAAAGQDGTVLATTDGGQSWATTSVASDVAGLAHCDSADAWTVGYGGLVEATTDGGATWRPLTRTTVGTYDGVAFADDDNGWAVGQNGVFGTTDGGATWMPRPLPPALSEPTGDASASEWLTAVACPDVSHAWAVGDQGTILRYDGFSWQGQGSGVSVDLLGVCAAGDLHAWAVGLDGTIVATTDGGSKWAPQRSHSTRDLRAVAFADRLHGWAVGGQGAILGTTNGGLTWKAQVCPSDYAACTLAGVAWTDPSHACIVATGDGPYPWDSGVVLRTNNGGATWRLAATGLRSLSGVAFADARHGWATTDSGAVDAGVYATNDGGATWHLEDVGTTDGLNAAACGDASHVWVVGSRGAILATTLASPAPSVALNASHRTVTRGKAVAVTGTVWHYRAADTTVNIYRRASGKLILLKRVAISRCGEFRWTVRPHRVGRWALIATYKVTGRTYSSRAVILKVRK